LRRSLASKPFPYTTLFRSVDHLQAALEQLRALVGRVAGGLDALREVGGELLADVGGNHLPAGLGRHQLRGGQALVAARQPGETGDRKSTRLNSSHVKISYA